MEQRSDCGWEGVSVRALLEGGMRFILYFVSCMEAVRFTLIFLGER